MSRNQFYKKRKQLLDRGILQAPGNGSSKNYIVGVTNNNNTLKPIRCTNFQFNIKEDKTLTATQNNDRNMLINAYRVYLRSSTNVIPSHGSHACDDSCPWSHVEHCYYVCRGSGNLHHCSATTCDQCVELVDARVCVLLGRSYDIGSENMSLFGPRRVACADGDKEEEGGEGYNDDDDADGNSDSLGGDCDGNDPVSLPASRDSQLEQPEHIHVAHQDIENDDEARDVGGEVDHKGSTAIKKRKEPEMKQKQIKVKKPRMGSTNENKETENIGGGGGDDDDDNVYKPSKHLPDLTMWLSRARAFAQTFITHPPDRDSTALLCMKLWTLIVRDGSYTVHRSQKAFEDHCRAVMVLQSKGGLTRSDGTKIIPAPSQQYAIIKRQRNQPTYTQPIATLQRAIAKLPSHIFC